MSAKTILCVDDDKQIRELLQTFLEGKGYQVVTSEDGWDCLRQIIVRKPDLILLDINMPKLDGINTLDMIKVARLDHHIPIILVSGEGDRETILKGTELGADDFVVKPFSFEELATRVLIQLYELSFEGLPEILKLIVGHETKEIRGLDLSRYHDWRAHAITHQGIELCILLDGALAGADLGQITRAQAAQSIVVLKKTRAQWKCVWPHAVESKTSTAA